MIGAGVGAGIARVPSGVTDSTEGIVAPEEQPGSADDSEVDKRSPDASELPSDWLDDDTTGATGMHERSSVDDRMWVSRYAKVRKHGMALPDTALRATSLSS
jgi:hypothetical protein